MNPVQEKGVISPSCTDLHIQPGGEERGGGQTREVTRGSESFGACLSSWAPPLLRGRAEATCTILLEEAQKAR